jgi:putative hemolysin
MNELLTPALCLLPVTLPARSLYSGLDNWLVPTATPSLQPNPGHGITVGWARHLDEVRDAQRLRYAVFAGEMGATLPNTLPGHGVELFDDFCGQLLVRNLASCKVIGTYRVLTPAQARASIPMNALGLGGSDHAAASIWRQVRQMHLASIEFHVRPRLPLPIEQLDNSLDVGPPALIKGYLRRGSKVLGPLA